MRDKEHLEQFFNVCSRLFTAMNWFTLDPISEDQCMTILAAWRRAEVDNDELNLNYTTRHTYHRLCGRKFDANPADFNRFTGDYNVFCSKNNTDPTQGFPEEHDTFFHSFCRMCKHKETERGTTPEHPWKEVRFDSLPPITTLDSDKTSTTDDDFPPLQDSSDKPFTYASATCRCRNRSKTPEPTTIPPPAKKPTIATPVVPMSGPKTLCKLKPTPKPLSDTLRTMKHTIILDHS